MALTSLLKLRPCSASFVIHGYVALRGRSLVAVASAVLVAQISVAALSLHPPRILRLRSWIIAPWGIWQRREGATCLRRQLLRSVSRVQGPSYHGTSLVLGRTCRGGPETPKLVAIQKFSRDVAHSIMIVPHCAAFLVAFAGVSHSRTKAP